MLATEAPLLLLVLAAATHVIEVPYDPAHPDAPTRAVVTTADEAPAPAPAPAAASAAPVEDGPLVVANPFHASAERLLAEAQAAEPKAPDRFVPDGPVRAPSL